MVDPGLQELSKKEDPSRLLSPTTGGCVHAMCFFVTGNLSWNVFLKKTAKFKKNETSTKNPIPQVDSHKL